MTLPLDLTSESLENPTGVSLYLNYDPSIISFNSATIGDKASKAEKSIFASPLGSNKIAILIIGFNITEIEDGSIANIAFSIANDASGSTMIDIEDSTAIITNANAKAIPITNIADGGISIGLKPDLVVQSIVIDPLNPNAYGPFSVYVTIKNQGPVGFSEMFWCGLNSPYLDTQLWSYLGLDAGAADTKQFDFPDGLPAGSHTLHAMADTDNHADESDEDNNGLSVPLIITPSPPNTPIGENVEVVMDNVTITFKIVIESGSTSVSESDTGHQAPPNFQGSCDPSVYYNITTTASYSDVVEVCIYYDDSLCDESNLHLLNYENDGWIDVTTSVDTTFNMICGEVTTLSEFLLVTCLSGCEGDFDCDGDVDGTDLAIFAMDFGRTNCQGGPPCEGDFDKDGDVDGSDLAMFATDFGRTNCL